MDKETQQSQQQDQIDNDSIPDKFEDLIKEKDLAFAFFASSKKLKDRFQEQDIQDFSRITQGRNKLCLLSILTSVLGIYYLDKAIKYRNIIFGLTQKSSLVKFVFKYYLIPQIFTRLLDNYIIYPYTLSMLNPIMSKYDFTEQIYQDHFEHFKLDQKIEQRGLKIEVIKDDNNDGKEKQITNTQKNQFNDIQRFDKNSQNNSFSYNYSTNK